MRNPDASVRNRCAVSTAKILSVFVSKWPHSCSPLYFIYSFAFFLFTVNFVLSMHALIPGKCVFDINGKNNSTLNHTSGFLFRKVGNLFLSFISIKLHNFEYSSGFCLPKGSVCL